MKSKLMLFVGITLAILNFYIPQAKAQWTWSLPNPQGLDLSDVFFVDDNIGYVVGWSGAIAKTTDAGATWTYLPCPSNKILSGVYFTHADTGIVVGASGTILRTVDGGQNWVIKDAGTTAQISAVYSFNRDKSIIVGNGGLIKKTIDGGDTWTTITTSSTNDLRDITFTGASNGYIVGHSSAYLKTTDGGDNWTVTNIGTGIYLNSINFYDASIGCAGGAFNAVYYTTNGGSTWTTGSTGVSLTIQDIVMTSATEGYAVGSDNRLIRTTNGGANWSNNYTSPSVWLNGICKTPNNTLFAVGGSGTGGHCTIVKGPTWSQIAPAISNVKTDIIFVPGTSTVFAFSSGGSCSKTTDNGVTWTSAASNGGGGYGQFISSTNGFAVGNSGFFSRTTNGGTSWNSYSTGTTQALKDVYFKDASNGFAVGGTAFIVTSNGGTSWSAVSGIPAGENFKKIYFADASNGFAVGNSLYKTTNGGASWSNTGFTGIHFSFVNKDTIMTIYYDNTAGNRQLAKSVDGGTSFTNISWISDEVTDIYFASSKLGYYVYNAEIHMTLTGGNGWSKQITPSLASTPIEMNYLSFKDANTGFAYSSLYGFVWRTTGSGPCNTASNILTFTQTLTDATLCTGNNLELEVLVNDNNYATYTWKKNGTPLANEYNSYNIVSATTANAGTYTCQASNACGSTAVATSVVVVNSAPNPTLTKNPTTAICPGDPVTLTVTGSGIDSYSWTPGGETTNAITVNPISTQSYSVNSTNGCGTVTRSATVTVNCPATGITSSVLEKLEIYPNPADGKLSITKQNPEVLDVQLVNALGEQVYQGKLEHTSTNLDLTGQTPGIYYLIIVQGENRSSRKIILQ